MGRGAQNNCGKQLARRLRRPHYCRPNPAPLELSDLSMGVRPCPWSSAMVHLRVAQGGGWRGGGGGGAQGCMKRGRGEGLWDPKVCVQKCVQKWPNQVFPMARFVFSDCDRFGLGGSGVGGGSTGGARALALLLIEAICTAKLGQGNNQRRWRGGGGRPGPLRANCWVPGLRRSRGPQALLGPHLRAARRTRDPSRDGQSGAAPGPCARSPSCCRPPAQSADPPRPWPCGSGPAFGASAAAWASPASRGHLRRGRTVGPPPSRGMCSHPARPFGLCCSRGPDSRLSRLAGDGSPPAVD